MELELSRRKRTIKTRTEINELDGRYTIEKKIDVTKSGFLEKINHTDKFLARLGGK